MIERCYRCGAPANIRSLKRVPFSDKMVCKDGCPVNIRKITEGMTAKP